MEKDMETTTLYMGYSRGSIGMMEKKMDTTTVYWGLYRGYIRIMDKKMEATTYRGYTYGWLSRLWSLFGYPRY